MSSTRELCLYDGHDDPTFILIFDNDDVHYFYWPYEFFSSSSVLQADDVEPIKKNGSKFISRYHYYGMTIWLDPKNYQSQNVCFFTKNWHTPIVITNGNTIKTVKLEDYSQIEWMEKIKYRFGKWCFEKQIKGVEIRDPRHYSEKIVKPEGSPFDEKKLFNKNYVKKFIKELIIIGDDVQIDRFVREIKNKHHNLNAENIADYFNF